MPNTFQNLNPQEESKRRAAMTSSPAFNKARQAELYYFKARYAIRANRYPKQWLRAYLSVFGAISNYFDLLSYYDEAQS